MRLKINIQLERFPFRGQASRRTLAVTTQHWREFQSKQLLAEHATPHHPTTQLPSTPHHLHHKAGHLFSTFVSCSWHFPLLGNLLISCLPSLPAPDLPPLIAHSSPLLKLLNYVAGRRGVAGAQPYPASPLHPQFFLRSLSLPSPRLISPQTVAVGATTVPSPAASDDGLPTNPTPPPTIHIYTHPSI